MFSPHRCLPSRFPPGILGCLGLSVLLATGLGRHNEALAQQPEPSPTAVPANPTVSGGRIVRPTLRLGSQGESVRELQSMLVLLGYYAGAVSGVFQEDTENAVQRFQQAAAITADGIVGPATWSKLFPAPAAEVTPPGQTVATTTPPATTPPATTPPATNSSAGTPPPTSASASLPILRPGMEGDAVRLLQRRLQANQIYNGPITGVFGPQTEAAVRQFQQRHNLLVDGIVGPATWGALN